MTPPVFPHGHLRLLILSLLDERPRHGYELIQDLSARFDGAYAPSAGTIYPRLAKLEQEGLVTKETTGRKSVYSLTPEGRDEVIRRRGELDGIEESAEDSLRRMAEQLREGLTTATAQLRDNLGSVGKDAKQFGEQTSRWAKQAADQVRAEFTEAPAGGDTEPRPQAAPKPRDTPPRGFAKAGSASSGSPESKQAHETVTDTASRLHDAVDAGEKSGRLGPATIALIRDELARATQTIEKALGK